MRAFRTVVLSGGGAATLAVLALSGCSASAHDPRPAAVRSVAPAPTTAGTPSPAASTPAVSPSARTTAPGTPASTTSPARPHRAPAPTSTHSYAPTAEDGLREDPGPRPTGQATGPGTVPQPGTSRPGQGPGDQPPATPVGIPPFPTHSP